MIGDPESIESLPVRVFAFVGVVSALAAGVAMLVVLMFISEVASDPTAVPGVESSTWTPLTGITSFLFGLDAFAGDFEVLSILFGLAAHLAFSILFGLLGVALIVATQGPRPGRLGAAMEGFVWGLFLQVFFLNLTINGGLQDVPSVYEALPQWGWWVGHAAYGATLGLVAAQLLAGQPRASRTATGRTPEATPFAVSR